MKPTLVLDNGRVRLYLGDCLKILPALPVGKIDTFVVDPPYGIAFRSNMRTATPKFDELENDATPFVDWIKPVVTIAKDPCSVTCFYRWDVQDQFVAAMTDARLMIKSQIVWWKPGGGIGDLKASFCPEHELALFAVRGKFEFKRGRPMSVFRVSKVPPHAMIHPTEKPISLIMKIVHAVADEWVCDPCMGSGATGAACVRLGLGFVGMEIDPNYFELAVNRIKSEIDKRGASMRLQQRTIADAPSFGFSK